MQSKLGQSLTNHQGVNTLGKNNNLQKCKNTKVKKTFKTAKKQKRHFAFCFLHFAFSFYYKRKYNDIKPVSSLLTTTG